MNTYYCLLKPPLPSFYGRETLRGYFKAYSKNFIDYVDFENWFGFKNTSIPITEIDKVFDLASTPDLKTVGLVINPYARTFLSYLAFNLLLHGTPLNTLEKVIANGSKENFKKFVLNDLRNNKVDNSLSINLVDLYEAGNIKIDYILRFEDIANGLKLIPEFKDRIDTNIFTEAQAVAALYKDYYDDETKQEVELVYGKDIAHYGYKF